MKKRLLWGILTVTWCVFIFYQSAKLAVDSARESSTIATAINSMFIFLFGQDVLVVSDNIIRKSAHFFEYLILGFMLCNSLFIRDRLAKTFALSIILGIFYSITDEVHQFFVPGRAMRAFDVMIDSIGIFMGVYIALLIYKRKTVRV